MQINFINIFDMIRYLPIVPSWKILSGDEFWTKDLWMHQGLMLNNWTANVSLQNKSLLQLYWKEQL